MSFQKNAFQNNAFQVPADPVVLPARRAAYVDRAGVEFCLAFLAVLSGLVW